MSLDFAILDVRQMALADRLTIAAGTPGFVLMENAGGAVAEEIRLRWTIRPVTILCGPGNNGGDGFVVARKLTEYGWPVRVALLGDRDHLKGDANHHAKLWTGIVEPLEPKVLTGAELVVDAVFGAGLNRELDELVRETFATAQRRGLPIVAVDVPSGVQGDTGASLGAVAAALTVTFFRKKPGHLLHPGRSLCGAIVVADIGISSEVLKQIQPQTFEVDPVCWSNAVERANGTSQAGNSLPIQRWSTDELHNQFGHSRDPLSLARAAASHSGRLVIVLGRNTLIADPESRVAIFSETVQEMAAAIPNDIFENAVREVMAPKSGLGKPECEAYNS